MARHFTLKSPLADDDLLFLSMDGHEQLSELFKYELDLLSPIPDLDFNQLVGDKLTVEAETASGQRFFNGFVSRFSHSGRWRSYHRYQATMVPWLWLLTRTSDCRIFQEMTVPDIIKQVFQDFGFADVCEDKLNGSYRKWNYCVQYRETSYNFVTRLMQQEGIYYFFKHDNGKHVLVLADSIDSHETFAGYETLAYRPTPSRTDNPFVDNWRIGRRLQPGVYAQNDYDFVTPTKQLLTSHSISRENQHGTYEVYDYPGEYTEHSDGTYYAQIRIEELQSRNEILQADSTARGLCCGHVFDLIEHERDDQNRKYLIIGVTHQLSTTAYEGGGEGENHFSSGLTAIDSTQPFRPARTSPKPMIAGPQTAVVVGPAGQEIWTDEFGRVKVQFHWDRYGKRDENSSCWIRVAQIWAGAQWGGMAVPRIGQEVIVEHEEGDPDRPLITGRVYNGDQMPPYTLPANMTQTGIKSRSSMKGTGDNFNEIRFEDKKGSEHVYIHAEKDKMVIVENDRTEDVGRDEKINIHRHRTEEVDENETITIHGNRTEEVDKDETITIHGNRTEEVDKDEKITIHGNRTEEVDKDEKITIHGNRTEEVDKNEKITIHGGRTEEVDKNEKITIHGGRTEKVDKDESVTVDGNRSVKIGKNDTLNVGKVLSITAGDQISITTGKASILMKSDGTITIKGKNITVDGSGQIVEKAKKDMILKGKKILQN